MASRNPVRVFVACRQAARWPALFAEHRAELLEATDVQDAEIVVADASWDQPASAPLRELAAARALGLIGLGPVSGAEVTIPFAAGSREIATACRLLGEVVRLRQRLQRSQSEHDQALLEARTDPLTGLPNRRAWGELLAGLSPPDVVAADQCVAIVDLDHFKEVNDRHSHAIGDAVLRSVAHALRAGLREQDFVTRLGGDEFGIVLIRLEEPEAGLVLERVRQRVWRAGNAGSLPPCSASIGYCVSSHLPNASADALMQAADQALGRAKSEGRNRIVAWAPK
jgi:diguanylate cyclase (GGDEF)-like protein